VAARGRPPLPRGVFAFDAPEWQPPKVVLLDTNVVAEALLANQPEHSACLAVLERLGTEGTTVIFSRLLEIELWEVAFNLALRERHPRKDVRHVRYDNRVRPRAACLLGQARKAWEKMLDSLAWSRVEIHDIASDVPRLMQDYGLQSYDAVHAATLMASEATDFVTRDGGFAVLPPAAATLHTTQARLVGTRARRRRAGYR
jgi:predicted nucleic acid-binding protein